MSTESTSTRELPKLEGCPCSVGEDEGVGVVGVVAWDEEDEGVGEVRAAWDEEDEGVGEVRVA